MFVCVSKSTRRDCLKPKSTTLSVSKQLMMYKFNLNRRQDKLNPPPHTHTFFSWILNKIQLSCLLFSLKSWLMAVGGLRYRSGEDQRTGIRYQSHRPACIASMYKDDEGGIWIWSQISAAVKCWKNPHIKFLISLEQRFTNSWFGSHLDQLNEKKRFTVRKV